jgi:hypothetical protein
MPSKPRKPTGPRPNAGRKPRHGVATISRTVGLIPELMARAEKRGRLSDVINDALAKLSDGSDGCADGGLNRAIGPEQQPIRSAFLLAKMTLATTGIKINELALANSFHPSIFSSATQPLPSTTRPSHHEHQKH